LLIELDGTNTQADKDRLMSDLSLSRLQKARAEAMLQALLTANKPVLQRLCCESIAVFRVAAIITRPIWRVSK
jgi:hypothetical protein